MPARLLGPVDAVWLMLETPDTPMRRGARHLQHAAQYDARLPAGSRRKNAPVPARCALGITARQRGQQWSPGADGGSAGCGPQLPFQHAALPAPGGERRCIMVSRLHSPALDGNRPCGKCTDRGAWRATAFGLYLKIHHALISNVNALPLAFSMLSHSARSRHMAPLWACPVPGMQSGDEPAREETNVVEALAAAGAPAWGLLRTALSPRKPAPCCCRGAPRYPP